MSAEALDGSDHQCDEEDDNPKRQLVETGSLVPTGDTPIWRLTRLRPAFLSMGILAFLTACLTGCAPLIPDLVRELRQDPTLPAHHGAGLSSISRLLSPRGQCVSIDNSDNSSSTTGLLRNTSRADGFRCQATPAAACDDLPAMCRYRGGLLACQTAAPVFAFAALCLMALAVCAARHCCTLRRLLLAALASACGGLAATIAFVACLHVLVSELSGSHSSIRTTYYYYYSADTTAARVAYATICLQAVLACQLACLPAALRRVTSDRARMLAWIRAG